MPDISAIEWDGETLASRAAPMARFCASLTLGLTALEQLPARLKKGVWALATTLNRGNAPSPVKG